MNSRLSGLSVFARARPPKIDAKRFEGLAAATPSPQALELWPAGMRAADMTSDNIVSVYGVIGEDFWTGGGVTADRVAGALRRIGSRDIEVHVNSPGGDMFEGVAIYNVLREHKQKVTVKVMGLAASAASIIAMAGDEVKVGLGSSIMIHNCWVMAVGNRHDMLEVAQYLEPFDASMRDIYVAATNQPKEKIAEWMDADTYFTAQQAIDNGFADAMLDSTETVDDPETKSAAQAMHAVRTIEANLTHKGGMTRSKARALINEMKGAKPDAGTDRSGKPDAAANATHDAGDIAWVASARDLIKAL